MKEQLRKFSDELRSKIKLFSKKRIDISEFIAGYDISNEDLSNSYISNLYQVEQNMSSCNLSNSTVKLIATKADARNCNFSFTQFLPGSNFSHADCRGSNFGSCNAANINFSYADLRDVNCCNSTFTLFSKQFYRAKFSKQFVYYLKRFLDVETLGVTDTDIEDLNT